MNCVKADIAEKLENVAYTLEGEDTAGCWQELHVNTTDVNGPWGQYVYDMLDLEHVDRSNGCNVAKNETHSNSLYNENCCYYMYNDDIMSKPLINSIN